jgi:hypothetical protein
MDFIPYTEKKSDFDKKIMLYIAKRIVDQPSDADAYNTGVTDLIGSRISDGKGVEWSYTELDKFIQHLRQKIGDKNLRELLDGYSFLKDVDPIICIDWDGKTDLRKMRKSLAELVTTVEDSDFLPPSSVRIGEHLEDDTVHSFQERVSRALTFLTFLLYALRKDAIPSSIDFQYNVCPSVEITFGHRAWPDYDWCRGRCEDSGLLESGKISKGGINMLRRASEKMFEGNLCRSDITRVDNQYNNWKRIASIS